jgi:hypothetical protein
MSTAVPPTVTNPKWMTWLGWVLTALPSLVLLGSAGYKFSGGKEFMDGLKKMGWDPGLAVPLAITELVHDSLSDSANECTRRDPAHRLHGRCDCCAHFSGGVVRVSSRFWRRHLARHFPPRAAAAGDPAVSLAGGFYGDPFSRSRNRTKEPSHVVCSRSGRHQKAFILTRMPPRSGSARTSAAGR